MKEEGREETTERPADGPGRGEPGDGGDLGETSQGQPGESHANAQADQGEAGRPDLGAERAEDTNERADTQARIEGPEGSEVSKRGEAPG